MNVVLNKGTTSFPISTDNNFSPYPTLYVILHRCLSPNMGLSTMVAVALSHRHAPISRKGYMVPSHYMNAYVSLGTSNITRNLAS
jgi:hypothetical protein